LDPGDEEGEGEDGVEYLVVSVHCGGEALRPRAIDGFQRAGQTLLQRGLFFQGKTPEHMIHGIVLRRADPHPKAGNGLRPKMFDNGFEAVMTARRAVWTEPQLAERK